MGNNKHKEEKLRQERAARHELLEVQRRQAAEEVHERVNTWYTESGKERTVRLERHELQQLFEHMCPSSSCLSDGLLDILYEEYAKYGDISAEVPCSAGPRTSETIWREPSGLIVTAAQKEAASSDTKPAAFVLDVDKLVIRYEAYVRLKPEIDRAFGRFDKNKNAKLERSELLALLKSIEAPDPEGDLEYIFRICDKNQDDALEAHELLPAIATWKKLLKKLPAPLPGAQLSKAMAKGAESVSQAAADLPVPAGVGAELNKAKSAASAKSTACLIL